MATLGLLQQVFVMHSLLDSVMTHYVVSNSKAAVSCSFSTEAQTRISKLRQSEKTPRMTDKVLRILLKSSTTGYGVHHLQYFAQM